MLNPEDRRAIEGLFDRLAEAERRAPNRDAEAEALIAREIVRQQSAPYYMAQTIVVQQQALEAAERRITELEAQEKQRDDRQVQRNRGPWDRADEVNETRYQRGGMGGGFLAGAMQTALGVAGGVLLGSAIGSLFGAGGAHAAEAPANNENNSAEDDSEQQDQSQDQDFGGDDFGGDGGFDMGGDF